MYGNWSGLTPSCQEQYCSFPGYLDNGKVGGATLLLEFLNIDIRIVIFIITF